MILSAFGGLIYSGLMCFDRIYVGVHSLD